MNKLMSNKNVNLDEFLREKNSKDNKNYLFINPLGEFKNKLSKNDKSIAKILLIEDLRYIMVLEREKHEYIFIYSKNNEETNVKINIKYDKRIFQFYKFHLFNNIIPIVNIKNSPKNYQKKFEKPIKR